MENQHITLKKFPLENRKNLSYTHVWLGINTLMHGTVEVGLYDEERNYVWTANLVFLEKMTPAHVGIINAWYLALLQKQVIEQYEKKENESIDRMIYQCVQLMYGKEDSKKLIVSILENGQHSLDELFTTVPPFDYVQEATTLSIQHSGLFDVDKLQDYVNANYSQEEKMLIQELLISYRERREKMARDY